MVTNSSPSCWVVHKFGGTSVADADCFRRVAWIVDRAAAHPDTRVCAVVSAVGGKPKVTDLLLETVRAAARRDPEAVEETLHRVLDKHTEIVRGLGLEDGDETFRRRLEADLDDVRDILKTVSLMKWNAERISELVSGYGELWSTRILCALLNAAEEERYAYVDARRVVTVDEEAGGSVCWGESGTKLTGLLEELPDTRHLVCTGYVASTKEGVATTLQRDGSDYSAAIMGRLLRAGSVTIWTDVDGVLSADPRRVPSAFPISEVSFNEAMELTYFGAKVLHPKTMQPAIMEDPVIPIYIRNTLTFPTKDVGPDYEHPGTRIHSSVTDRERCVCGFSTMDDMAVLNVEGSGMLGVYGVVNRLFQALAVAGVNIVFLSQASSEHSITLAVRAAQCDAARAAVEGAAVGSGAAVDVLLGCSIIAAVGDGMSYTAGVSGRFFGALGEAGINVLAVAQGSSQRNISCVVRSEDSTRALRAVHAAFRLSRTTVRAAVVGVDADPEANDIGRALLRLLEEQRDKLRDTFDIDLCVCAVLPDSRSDVVVRLRDDRGDDSVDLHSYDAASRRSDERDDERSVARAVPGSVDTLIDHVLKEECPHTVVFDCTADEVVGARHPEWLRRRVHVITANSTALSGPAELRADLAAAERTYGRQSASYLREVTVGGALPVLTTLGNLLNSGDRVRRVDGVLSTSLSYIAYRVAPPPGGAAAAAFDDSFTGGLTANEVMTEHLHTTPCSFSRAVDEARALGLMEDDPRKDLDNEYTARCLMVVARALGLDDGSLDAGEVARTMTDDLAATDGSVDERMAERVRRAAEKGRVPRHVASIDVRKRSLEIGLVDVPVGHVFATTPPSCECVRFFTEHHKPFPLVIQGPSAGLHSTASGLLAELMHLMRGKVGTESPHRGVTRTSSSAQLGKRRSFKLA